MISSSSFTPLRCVCLLLVAGLLVLPHLNDTILGGNSLMMVQAHKAVRRGRVRGNRRRRHLQDPDVVYVPGPADTETDGDSTIPYRPEIPPPIAGSDMMKNGMDEMVYNLGMTPEDIMMALDDFAAHHGNDEDQQLLAMLSHAVDSLEITPDQVVAVLEATGNNVHDNNDPDYDHLFDPVAPHHTDMEDYYNYYHAGEDDGMSMNDDYYYDDNDDSVVEPPSTKSKKSMMGMGMGMDSESKMAMGSSSKMMRRIIAVTNKASMKERVAPLDKKTMKHAKKSKKAAVKKMKSKTKMTTSKKMKTMKHKMKKSKKQCSKDYVSPETLCQMFEVFDNYGRMEHDDPSVPGFEWHRSCDDFEPLHAHLCPASDSRAVDNICNHQNPDLNNAVRRYYCEPLFADLHYDNRSSLNATRCELWCTNFVSRDRGDCCDWQCPS